MIFTSFNFIIFLFIVYFIYRCLDHRHQNILILIASYVFYSWWDIRFLFLIVVSTVVNYCCGILIVHSQMRKHQQITASVWILLTCLFVVTFQRQDVQWFIGIPFSSIDWQSLLVWDSNWIIVGIVLIFVVLLNLYHPRIQNVQDSTRRKTALIVGIVANLSILCFFKYYNFFVDNLEWAIQALRLDPRTLHLNIVLPIGVSFYTFKGISYCMDTYRGDCSPAPRYVDFAAFIAFFPAILAGPIDRASNLLEQFYLKRKLTLDQTLRGSHLIFYGLFKKVVIADGVAGTVNSVFGTTGHVSWIDVVVASFLFTLQIYCDFSGYTDMARGIAKLFGFDLIVNFKMPYFSQNPREFWARWHISLSTWLRDYLYIPLGGSKHGVCKTYRNLMFTMVLGGLWHGAAWNFVLWGFYHGCLLCLHRVLLSINAFGKIFLVKPPFFIKVIFFFILTCYGWLLFRATSLSSVMSLTSTLIFDFGNMDMGVKYPKLAAIFGLPVFFVIEIIEARNNAQPFYEKTAVPVWTAIYALMIFCLGIGLTTESAQFIYMNF